MEYAALINKTDVVQVIVGSAQWATETLGGVWVPAPSTAGAGWLYVDGEFRPPAPYPSWTWDGSEYQPPKPEPKPEDGYYFAWDEDAQKWVKHEVPAADAV